MIEVETQREVWKRASRKYYYAHLTPELLAQRAEKSRQNRAANPEYSREYRKRYIADNRDKVNALNAKRRTANRNALPFWSELDKIAVVYEKAQAWKMEVDHIVPILSDKVCGLHVLANLQLLHMTDNVRKGNKFWPDMWGDESLNYAI